MAKKFNDPSIATITVLNDADMMSTFNASTGELSKILVSDMKASGFGRFGVSGEDDIAAENRNMDLGAFGFDMVAGTPTDYSEFFQNPSADMGISTVTATGIGVILTGIGANGGSAQMQGFDPSDGSHSRTLTIDKANINLAWGEDGSVLNFVNPGSPTAYSPLSVNGTFADSAGNIPLVEIADDFLNDAAAATGGIAVGGLYHTSGVVKIRLS